MTYLICPSILAADFTRLGEEVNNVLTAGADMIHFDVMDNHYVPNLSVGPLVLASMRKHLTCQVDVHLMVKPVDALVEDFADHRPEYISVHPETTEHLHRTLGNIADKGCKPGIVFNPATPLDVLDEVIDMVDLILIMSVNPGFGGQKFIESSKRKLTEARERIDKTGRDIRLQIDGGVSEHNIADVARAGADTFVAGSAIFGSDDYAATIARMRDALAGV
jgi:ribulose-phosphate 3-epimerase